MLDEQILLQGAGCRVEGVDGLDDVLIAGLQGGDQHAKSACPFEGDPDDGLEFHPEGLGLAVCKWWYVVLRGLVASLSMTMRIW